MKKACTNKFVEKNCKFWKRFQKYMNTVIYNIQSVTPVLEYLPLQSTGFFDVLLSIYIGNTPKDRHCGHTWRAFNISFTSGRDSISKVSPCGQEGPELFVNTRYFIHLISLAEGPGHHREIYESVSAGYARERRGYRGIAIFSFIWELISYRLDFPRRAPEFLMLITARRDSLEKYLYDTAFSVHF